MLAVSPQSVQSHDDFSCKQGGFAFPLLADTDKAVGEAYGILGPLGFYRRSAFVIDAEGIVRYAHRAVAGLTFRSTDELVAAVKARQLAALLLVGDAEEAASGDDPDAAPEGDAGEHPGDARRCTRRGSLPP